MTAQLDRDIVAYLYAKYHQSVRRCCMKILGDSANVDDLCHEAFIRLLSRHTQYLSRRH